MRRRKLTVTRKDGTKVVYTNVVSCDIKPSMIKLNTMKEGDQQTKTFAIKDWVECAYD